MELTDEIRQAVHTEDCDRLGHQFDFTNTMAPDITKAGRIKHRLGSTDDLKLPYIECTRCERVWIVTPEDKFGYEDAERNLYKDLDPEAKLAKLIVRLRGKREERDQRQEDDPPPEGS